MNKQIRHLIVKSISILALALTSEFSEAGAGAPLNAQNRAIKGFKSKGTTVVPASLMAHNKPLNARLLKELQKLHNCPTWVKIVPVEREYFEAAVRHKLCPSLFRAILGAESNWNHEAFNPFTLDYGIGQINYKTAEALSIDLKQLRANRAYSIEKAAYVLANHEKLFKRKLGPLKWICGYNLGYAAAKAPKACDLYIEKVKRHNY